VDGCTNNAGRQRPFREAAELDRPGTCEQCLEYLILQPPDACVPNLPGSPTAQVPLLPASVPDLRRVLALIRRISALPTTTPRSFHTLMGRGIFRLLARTFYYICTYHCGNVQRHERESGPISQARCSIACIICTRAYVPSVFAQSGRMHSQRHSAVQ
jgi:hypothetical protein